ncbi:hypothetical protein BKA70DRAFT_1347527 [Coprinopsis sp. MPI-PUGE-AT-0042]|nr:hypothetical protein BKA70DRAFT_1347527 [Coprinopsis sp. MPI-PUGE-AT-0042]
MNPAQIISRIVEGAIGLSLQCLDNHWLWALPTLLLVRWLVSPSSTRRSHTPFKGKILRYTGEPRQPTARLGRYEGIDINLPDFSLEYTRSSGEEQPGDVDVSKLSFFVGRRNRILPLTRSSPDHWIVENNTSISLSAQPENVIVPVALQTRDLDDIATTILFQDQQLIRGVNQRVEMQDLSSYTRTGRWFLSWQVEMVDMDESPSPIPNQPDAMEPAGFDEDRNVITYESSLLGRVHRSTGLEEDQFRLTDIAITYTPDDGTPSSVNVEGASMVFYAGDQDWSLTLTASAANCWEAEGQMTIAMPQDMEGMTVSLKDSDLKHVALVFISREEIFEGVTKALDTDYDPNGLYRYHCCRSIF